MVLDCKKTNRAARHWKQPPKKPFHHVSRDTILQDSYSILAALTRGSPIAILNEGPGDEVAITHFTVAYLVPWPLSGSEAGGGLVCYKPTCFSNV